MIVMAVDLSTKYGGALAVHEGVRDDLKHQDKNNNLITAVDLSLPKAYIGENNNLDLKSSIANSGDTMDILKRLMKATGSDITEDDKSQIELTALNLLCLARLQEMLRRGPDGRHPLPAHLLKTQIGSSSTPWNRKMYSCDFEGCKKVIT